MPACSSSLILDRLAQLGSVPDTAERDGTDLIAVLARVPDPRARRGIRHRLVAVLAIGVCAVLAGARTFTAIAEWANDLPAGVRDRLGLGRGAPCESTIRRTLQAVDADALDAVLSQWLLHRAPTSAERRRIAVDGKSARGARGGDGRPVHLFAAFDHTSGIVLGQTVVDAKTNEINAFVPLLDRIELTDVIVTADALHTQHRHADYLHQRGAHYLLTVKGNQPTLHEQLRALPWAQIPTVDRCTDKGHGRIESRALQVTAIDTGIGFPHARLAIRVIRRRNIKGRKHTETVYAITDLNFGQIRADQLADALRGHWGIENRLHWVRDVTFAEDHSQVRTAAGPAVMATLRNLAVSLHRLAGTSNIAAACRHVSRHPSRVLPLLT